MAVQASSTVIKNKKYLACHKQFGSWSILLPRDNIALKAVSVMEQYGGLSFGYCHSNIWQGD